ncbi:MAG: Rpn family recombination-promoting nuclease/putative transposase [Microcystis sp. M015S2]|uniref:Rpn family recombination-promoting nuclease/putative transposase n=1 Tax=unclassified Microcystis TaxID=2643300 RepID=UPI00258A6697|nr:MULTISPECIES: Rpn family recombination-promoting nuclease/putative transposase [unclassified Microcystis]MCA2709031.1 Rpn family recombination-promoting nuclease/putative transposase [Microcystis sp. M025S2]MCA2741822.1 Rpn family recombination-promoting nuclease/putative transposase [Microcystis sp. M015S2]MCA2759723.1 Rpn family recombination-promoting nuclease/putative transposase [Microcystis sp. M145S2]
MKTDSIFYQLLQRFPACFFDLLNLPPETANSYQFSSVEVKQLSFRLDGVFLPDTANQPIYFLEVQFQKDNRFYSRFFSEIFLYLHQTDLSNNWQGVVIYPRRSVESVETARYGELINSGRILRFYLEELREVESLGISMLQLIIAPTTRAIEQGKQLIPRIRQELPKVKQQQELLELIETILVYKLPQVSRKEIEAMFSLSDLKQTKVYQEALEEGREEGELAAKLASIPRLLALGLNFEQIAQALELDIEQVRQATQGE